LSGTSWNLCACEASLFGLLCAWRKVQILRQQQPPEPKHTNTHNGNLHGLLPVLHRSDRWPTPVRPVTPVRLVGRAGEAGGYNSHTTSVPESLNDFSRPENKNTPKTQPARKEKPTQNLTNQPQTSQELTSSSKTQRHTSQAVHLRKIPQMTHTGHQSRAPVRPV
jgi:hypothetical protein